MNVGTLALAATISQAQPPAVLGMCVTYDSAVTVRPVSPATTVRHGLQYTRHTDASEHNALPALREVPTYTTRKGIERTLKITDSVYRANANIALTYIIKATANITPTSALTGTKKDSLANKAADASVLARIRQSCPYDIAIHFGGQPRDATVAELIDQYAPRNVVGRAANGTGSALVYADARSTLRNWTPSLQSRVEYAKPLSQAPEVQEAFARARAEIAIHEIGHLFGLEHESDTVSSQLPKFRKGSPAKFYSFMHKKSVDPHHNIGWSTAMNAIKNRTSGELRTMLKNPHYLIQQSLKQK